LSFSALAIILDSKVFIWGKVGIVLCHEFESINFAEGFQEIINRTGNLEDDYALRCECSWIIAKFHLAIGLRKDFLETIKNRTEAISLPSSRGQTER